MHNVIFTEHVTFNIKKNIADTSEILREISPLPPKNDDALVTP